MKPGLEAMVEVQAVVVFDRGGIGPLGEVVEEGVPLLEVLPGRGVMIGALEGAFRLVVLGHVVVEVHEPRLDESAGVDPAGVVTPRGGGVAACRPALEDPRVDVQDPVGDLGPVIVEGHEVTRDRERRGTEWCGRACYEEI
jgi:hypothetical protein